MKLIITAALMLLICPVLSHAAVVDEFVVEGVMQETSDPSQSMVIIDGEILKEGDVYKGVRIEKIGRDHATGVIEKTGEEVRIEVTGGAAAANAGQSLQSPGFLTVEDRMKQKRANPVMEFFYRIREVGVIAELRKVHTAATIDYADNGPDPTLTLKKLVERGQLSPAYADGIRAGYQFTAKTGSDGALVYASPAGIGGGRHFFIDEDGVIFVEDKSPASRNSREYGG